MTNMEQKIVFCVFNGSVDNMVDPLNDADLGNNFALTWRSDDQSTPDDAYCFLVVRLSEVFERSTTVRLFVHLRREGVKRMVAYEATKKIISNIAKVGEMIEYNNYRYSYSHSSEWNKTRRITERKFVHSTEVSSSQSDTATSVMAEWEIELLNSGQPHLS